jgi:hypothetical protein
LESEEMTFVSCRLGKIRVDKLVSFRVITETCRIDSPGLDKRLINRESNPAGSVIEPEGNGKYLHRWTFTFLVGETGFLPRDTHCDQFHIVRLWIFGVSLRCSSEATGRWEMVK